MDPTAADLPALADLWRWCATEGYADSALYRTIAAALAEFPLWMESNSAIDIRGMRKEMKVLPAR